MASTPPPKLSQLVRQRMSDLALTQMQVAERAGLHQSTISHLLRRTRVKYSVDTLRQLAGAIEVDLLEVLESLARETRVSEDERITDRELTEATQRLVAEADVEAKAKAVVALRRLLGRPGRQA